jgi:hypothetical protein
MNIAPNPINPEYDTPPPEACRIQGTPEACIPNRTVTVAINKQMSDSLFGDEMR